MRIATVVTAIIVMAGAETAQGQYAYPAPYYAGGNSYHHASTVEEGLSRGIADVIRSKGAADLMHSEAAKNYEDAKRQRIDNRLYGTQTYFEMRRVNREARAAERGPKPTQQDAIRYAQSKRPARLTTTDLDPLTGAIAWPALLREEFYNGQRQQLDVLFSQRAQNGYLNSEQLLSVDYFANEMKQVLKTYLNRYPSQMYTHSRNFIDSLAYEMYMAPG